MSLTKCLDIARRLPQSDADELLARLDRYQTEGMPASRAQSAAAQDVLRDIEQERKMLVKAIAKQHPGVEVPVEPQGEQVATNDLHRLATEFSKRLIGVGFDINEARKFAGEILGKPVKPGTMLAKQIDEALELGIVLAARRMIEGMRGRGASDKEIYGALRSFYGRQPNLNVRTSTSIANQAYSTPVPLAFLASRLAGIQPTGNMVYEPTAGNGALLIEVQPKWAIPNELNPDRRAALAAQGFSDKWDKDASTLDPGAPVDVVIANPPFGYVKDERGRNREWKVDERYTTNQIDHAIAMKALEAMKDDGRAVLIVAAPNKLVQGEALADAYNGKALRSFYYTLYGAYNVVDHFTVSGDLYAKQGAAWPVDVIVIRGRGKSARNLPAADLPKLYESWDALQEKFDARYAEGAGPDRREGDTPARPGGRQGERDAARGAEARRGGPAAGERGQGRPAAVRGGPDLQQPHAPGLAAGEGDQRGQPAARGDLRATDRPADAEGDRADVGKLFDEEFSKLFGDLSKSAARETAAGLESVAKGLDELFGGKGRLGSGLQFDEQTYAKAKPFFIEGVKHFKQAAADIRDMVRMLLTELRTKFAMTAEAIMRMKPYVVRFIEDVTAGRIQLEAIRRRDVETVHQTHYEPKSQVGSIGTLVPVNMSASVKESLDALVEKVGELDQYVARELGYDVIKLGDYFSAEQVDALALALDAIGQGKGFIIGDQTGVGKGRVVAGIIKWAIKNGKTPIFTTEKPNLYKDIYRDLVDIGMQDVNPIMTNAGESIPLTDDGEVVLKSKSGPHHNAHLKELIDSGSLGDYDVVFTTYNQMQTIKGGQRTARMDFLETFARGGVVIFDESHNAGGAVTEKPSWDEDKLDRARFARNIAASAGAVFYSSAAYAKRPEVMDLYFKTDMHLAVDSPKALAPAIRAGGVPLQQVVASMLAKAGQYIRRERSFAGLSYDSVITPVNRAIAERMSTIMRAVSAFDDLKKAAVAHLKKQVRAEAKTVTGDGSTGLAGVHSTNFTSIMHNMVDQMLLALKVVPAADMAIEAAKRGEKPVLTVANTMGSFIEHYVEDHNLNTGDGIAISFRDLLLRYLERSRDVTIKDAFGKPTRRRLTDHELGPTGTRFYEELKKHIEESDFSDIPLSPIDFLKAKVQAAGYKFGEITGRQHVIDYGGEAPVYRLRPGKELSIRGRNETISAFNNGRLDILLINQAGATGLSLHASEKVRDQRKRHMVIIQAERNIDTHMQMLGRVHRTGQVVVPSYAQLVADIPAEKRPAAVLAKKMASLNANTTGARGSAVMAKDVVDFMNEYGDEVVAQLMEDHPEWHRMMGRPLDPAQAGEGLEREEAIRKVTGRIPLLPIAQQEQLYDLIESEYRDLLEEKDRLGENALEAKTLELDAKLLKTIPVFEGKGGASPFAQGAAGEVMDVKRLGKPYTSEEVLGIVRAALELNAEASYLQVQQTGRERSEKMIEDLNERFDDYQKQVLDDAKDRSDRDAQNARVTLQRNRVNDLLAIAPVGRLLTINTAFGSVPAVVTKVEQKGSPRNPAALGTWKFTFAVADAVRHVTIPASRLFTAAQRPGFGSLEALLSKQINLADYIAPERLKGKPPLTVFDEAQSQSREERVIITGNLLAGFGRFKNGRITNFRMADGQLRQGILMPASFDLDKAIHEAPVEFPDAVAALNFLAQMEREGKSAVLNSVEEKVFRVAKVGGEETYRISVAASRETGGRIYLDPGVLKAAGQDFVKAGASMRVDLPTQTAARTLQAIMNLGYKIHTTAFRQEAKDFLGARGQVSEQAFEPGRRRFIQQAGALAISSIAPIGRTEEAQVPVSESGTAGAAIRWIEENSASPMYREVARRIRPLVESTPVRVIKPGVKYDFPIPGNLQNARGVTLLNITPSGAPQVRIYLRSDIGLREETVLHEGVHGGLNHFIRSNPAHAAVKRLNELLAEVRAATASHADSAYLRVALENVYELVGYGLTDQRFQRILRGIKVKAQTAWQSFIDIIARILGIGESRADVRSALEELFDASFHIIEEAKLSVGAVSHVVDEAVFAQQLAPGRASMDRDTSLTDKIVSAPFKLAKWDRLAQSAWAKISELNERITDKSGIYETARAGVESDFGLEEAYVDRRIEMQVNLQKWARGAVTMLDKLGALTREESRVAYEWMNERDADDLIRALPEQSKQTLRELKELIRALGEEAVELGQLSREVFERNELAYLHRSYLRHELEETIAQRLGKRKAIALWGDQYKGRGLKDWRTQGELNGWAGEMLNPQTMKGRKFHRLELRARVPEDVTGRLEALGGHRPLGRLRKVVYVPEGKPIPREYAGWHDDGIWEVRWFHGGKWGLWRDLTKEERIALGEIDEVRFAVAKTLHLMTHDIEIGRMQKWIAENYAKRRLSPGDREVSAKESLAATFGRNTWVKVPMTEITGTNVKKYGDLAGLYVPGPIWNDVRQRVAIGEKPGVMVKLWDDMMRLWKISKTAMSPGVHTNNVMANFFIADFHDLRAKDLLKALTVMLDVKFSSSPSQDHADLYRRFEDSGALHGMFKYHELKREALDPLLEDIRNEALNNEEAAMSRVLSVLSWLNTLERGAKKAAGAMIETYGAEDEVFRLALFIKGVRHGVADLEAGKLARKAFLDYDINAPWIQGLRRTAFPFIAFPYRAIPMMIHTFTHKPWKLIKYVGVAWALNALAYAMLGLGDEDEERERRLMPEEKAGRIWGLFPKMIRMPWNSDSGNPVFLDVRRWFPSGDIFDVGGTHAAIPWSPTALPGGPVALLAELFANKSQFTGQDITQTTDTGLETAKKVGAHLFRFAMPNLFMIPGTWSFEGIRGSLGLSDAGKVTDVFGREMSVPQAFLSALGVKLGTYPEDVMRYNLVRKTDREVNEILGNIYKATGDVQRNRMSKEKFAEYAKEQMEKIKRLQEEAAKKLQPARP